MLPLSEVGLQFQVSYDLRYLQQVLSLFSLLSDKLLFTVFTADAAYCKADSKALPECGGERLGRLIRIGLLQLISSTEGVQSQSVPETFMLNWMRLRSVQSKFQQVIVIATR